MIDPFCLWGGEDVTRLGRSIKTFSRRSGLKVKSKATQVFGN